MLVTELKLAEDMAEKLPDEIAGTYWKMASSIAAIEEHAPMFFVVTGRKAIHMVATGEFRDMEGKNRVAVLLRSMARNADVVVIICEAHTVRNPGKDAMKAASRGRLSEHKDAREILSVLVQHRRFGSTFWSAEITHGPNGRKIGPVCTDKADSGGGRFDGMVPDVKVAQA